VITIKPTPTEYTLCALAVNDPNYQHGAIQVRHVGDGRWVVHHLGAYLYEHGGWEPGLGNATRFDEHDALRKASAEAVAIMRGGIPGWGPQ